ncbi:MAG: NADH:ubiquinone reductase (Na(+)-transporting) subunit C [Verrucomicrobiota bacterium]
MHKDVQTIGFAATICVVCSLILSLSASGLKSRIETNKTVDVKKNVLMAFGESMTVKEGDKERPIKGEEVYKIFEDHITEIVIDRDTGEIDESLTAAALAEKPQLDTNGLPTKLPLYLWKDDGKVTRMAFPQKGRGLWSTVYSYMAVDAKATSIIGATFYGHKETPGLGGECSQPWFMEQFPEKVIWEDGKYPPFEVVKGGVATRYPDGNNHAVDGISGATITGNGIQDFINQYVGLYSKYFDKARDMN